MRTLVGSCSCGDVKVAVRGEALRTGICHCTDCRQESGSAFTFFGVWPASGFELKGETREFRGRSFCPKCGSRLFSANEQEAEVKLGILSDAAKACVRTLGKTPGTLASSDRGGRAI